MQLPLLLTALIAAALTLGSAGDLSAQSGSAASPKVLIAYFSWGGNTKTIADNIKNATGGDLFQVATAQAYPTEYRSTTEAAKKEQEDNARPQLRGQVSNMADYDVIFLGYPNWWGTMPMAMFTFLESYDFSGKTIIPFCTHEGSRLGRSVDDLKKLAPGATIREGLAIRGGSVGSAEGDVQKWLSSLGFGK